MTNPHLLTLAQLAEFSETDIPTQLGRKAWGLYTAYQLGISIPFTWIISTKWHQKFCEENPTASKNNFLPTATQFVIENFHTEILALPEQTYAVRSSSQFEDISTQSFARIFESRLHVKKSELAYTIAKVWASDLSERGSVYFDDITALTTAIVLQPMIPVKYSGVCYTKPPSSNTALEDHNIIIELAVAEDEKVMQGEVTPLRFSGNIQQLSNCINERWLQDLLNAVLALKTIEQNEIAIEFIVDKKLNFYLVQQNPLSTYHQSKTLDLSSYFLAYKRSLYCLDIEMMMEGCSQHLPDYLEIPYELDAWMIMITTAQGAQELWLHKIINQAIVNKVAEKMVGDAHYLTRLHDRYQRHHQRTLSYQYQIFFKNDTSLVDRFLNWVDFIKPLHAHYYVPIFMLDALSQILLIHMRRIDLKNAESDLLSMGTAEVKTLNDFLNMKLLAVKPSIPNNSTAFTELPKEIQTKLQQLAKQFGFLKCHQVYETGYNAEELLAMAHQLESANATAIKIDQQLYDKYITNAHISYLFEQLQQWIDIRNQKMEYLMFAVLASRPLIEELAETLQITVKELWSLSKNTIINCLKNENNNYIKQFSTENLTIFREDGKTHVTNQLKICNSSSRIDLY